MTLVNEAQTVVLPGERLTWVEICQRYPAEWVVLAEFDRPGDENWRDEHDVERDDAEYIDGFYNSRRRRAHNSYLGLIDFEHQFLQQENAA